jgi:hypothetical protein
LPLCLFPLFNTCLRARAPLIIKKMTPGTLGFFTLVASTRELKTAI